MAGIEKVCEFEKGGHWHGPDTFDCYNRTTGKTIYQDTIQVCEDHRDEFTRMAKGKPHRIVLFPRNWEWQPFMTKAGDIWERHRPADRRDFELFVDGLPNPFTSDNGWMRWYYDKRKWRRNMRKLLGVKRLNIEYAKEAHK